MRHFLDVLTALLEWFASALKCTINTRLTSRFGFGLHLEG